MRSSGRASTFSGPSSATRSPRSGSGVPAARLSGARSGEGAPPGMPDARRVRREQGHQASAMPGVTPTSTSRGSSAAIAPRSASTQLVAAFDALGLHPVAGGQRGGVERGQVQARRRVHVLQRGEPLQDRVLGVAQDQERDGHVVGHRGPQALDRVLGRALAEDAHDRARRLRQLHADRCRQRESQPAAGAEVVRAGARRAHLVAQRERARGRLEHDDPVVGEHLGQRRRARWSGSAGSWPRAPRPRAAHRGAERSEPPAASASAASVSATSATIASPIGARAASSGSLVMATRLVPSASSGPGMFG